MSLNSLLPATVYLIAVLSLTSCAKGSKIVQVSDQELASISMLDQHQVSNFAKLALKGIKKEYPNKLSHVMNDKSEVKSPSELHPVFYGCFDWHSSVHGHWMLVRILKLYPDIPEAGDIRKALGDNMTAKNMEAEVAYLNQKSRKSFERTYGWAWLLKLAEELQTWDDPDGAKWSKNIKPLADAIADRYIAFFPKQVYPIRRGVHPNTAFGIAFALDYARVAGHKELEDLMIERSIIYFGVDLNFPAQWEPDGDDFFSRSLIEADLMHRILDKRQYTDWLKGFLPDLNMGLPLSIIRPADVSDRSDPKIVHLDGLNLSRAWCMKGIANVLDNGDPIKNILLKSAAAHAKATLPHIASGNYEGEHWLASFAFYMITTPSIEINKGDVNQKR